MKKKCVAVLICAIMVMSLAACSSSSITEKEETAEGTDEKNSEKEDVEAEEKADYSDETGLVKCFAEAAEGIGAMTYDEAVQCVNDSGFAYENVDPSAEDMGTITTEDDEDGCHLYIATFPDNSGEDTVCSVSYGNGHFEGSVSNSTHVTDPVYKTYNIYNESPNTEVDNLEDVLAYIHDEMPALIAEENAREPGEPLDVTLAVSGEVTDEGTVFTVDTNLPDGTRMMISLDVNGKNRTGDMTVENGKAVSVAMTESGVPLRGNFEVRVSMVNAIQQPSEVQNIIGVDGENLAGEYVGEAITGDPTISATFDVTID